jgi:hypothetical protein
MNRWLKLCFWAVAGFLPVALGADFVSVACTVAARKYGTRAPNPSTGQIYKFVGRHWTVYVTETYWTVCTVAETVFFTWMGVVILMFLMLWLFRRRPT